MAYLDEYKSKLITVEKAAAMVKSNDKIVYGSWGLFPYDFDAALAERIGTGELKNLNIRTVSTQMPVPSHEKNGDGDDLVYGSWYYSGLDRQQGVKIPRRAYYPIHYHEVSDLYTQDQFSHLFPDLFVIQATPMDKHGFFNFGVDNSGTLDMALAAKTVIIITNETAPHCLGGFGEGINLRDVDYVIEGSNTPIVATPPPAAPSPEEEVISRLIVEDIPNGACLQLGIGSLPNAIGELLCDSDLKDLGISTEMFCDSFVNLYEAGKITNRYKGADKYKAGYTFALGTREMYEFMDNNPNLASLPVAHINDPHYIRSHPNMISINNLLEIDLLSQVTSETAGLRQISGSGGQVDYCIGAYESEGGKSFLAFTSSFVDKQGNRQSRIRPTLPTGAVVTTPRTFVHWLVTEYGKVNMRGKSTWERAEALISIAHPDFREDLIKDAEKMGIWKPSNKRDG